MSAMDDEILRRLERWETADASGREDEADLACRAMFAAMPAGTSVPAEFTAATLAAIQEAAAQDRLRARRVRQLGTAAALIGIVGGLYAGGGLLLTSLSGLLVGLIDILIGATVSVAASVHAGADLWTLLASLGRAAAAFAAEPAVTFAMLAMQGLAMAALIALQRLLGSDREPLK